jgi:PAS domain S-box-containing protein
MDRLPKPRTEKMRGFLFSGEGMKDDNETERKNRPEADHHRVVMGMLFGCLILSILYMTSLFSYPLFHALVEIYVVVIAGSIFMFSWNTRKHMENDYLLLIGISYFFVGVLELFHMLAYKGMGVFHGIDSNPATQLWISSRYVESLSFLIAPIYIRRRLNHNLAFAVYAVITFLLLNSIFYWRVFPDCFIAGSGLTRCKIVSEYIIVLILAVAIALLFRYRKKFERSVLLMLALSMILTILAEFSFTFYISVYGLSNLIGHFFTLLSFYLIYRAIIVTGMARPVNLLFNSLARSEAALRSANTALEATVVERTSDLVRMNDQLKIELMERERAEAELARVNRALRMLNETNETMIHSTDESTLLNNVCRISVDVGGYRMAWVGFKEWDEGKTIRPVAHAGFDSGYIESTKVTWGDDECGRGPGGIAIRTGQPYIVRNIPEDPVFALWREEATRRGYQSIIALPLISEGRTLGAMGIYAGETDAFNAEEAEILKQLANDLAFGVTTLRTRVKGDLAQEALRHSENEKTILNEIANIFLTVPDEAMFGKVLEVVLRAMDSRYGMFGFIDAEGNLAVPSLTTDIWNECRVPGKSVVFPSASWGESLWGKAITEKKTFCSGGPFHTPEGHVPIDRFLVTPIIFGQKTIGIISVANKEGGYTRRDRDLQERIACYISPILNARLQKDILERKRMLTMDALRESEEKYRGVVENVGIGISVISPNMEILALNNQMKKWFPDVDVSKKPVCYKAFNNPPRDTVCSYCPTYKTLEDGRVHESVTETPAGNTTRNYRIISSPLRDKDNKVNAAIEMVEDITERMMAEEQLHETLERLRKAVGTTIQVMVSAVESRDPYTAGHQIRSSKLARAIATEMGLSHETIEGIRIASSIHDIGKLSVPAEILSRPTKLKEIERLLIKQHVKCGYNILKNVESPWPLAEIVYQHHERMDGSGYPRSLKGAEILMEARILAVADVVESMSSHRPYRPALGIETALEEIETNKGTLYDDHVVDVCLRLFREKGYKLERE